jgi:LytS/YehU family sensor histidine kinase
MTQTALEKTAQKFSLSEKELIQEGVKAFLQSQLRIVETERQRIFAKFDVSSLDGLDAIISENPEQESDLLPDLQKADYLTTRVDEIKKMIFDLKK